MRRLALTAIVLALTSCGGSPDPENNPNLGACSDGVDNDGDGAIDFPDDLGCVGTDDGSEDSPTNPKCSDGRDNDGDGKVDFPDDPGCFLSNSDDEIDDCPDGPGCPQCGNGQDDDMNGSIDYPDDPGCESAADTSEFLDNPVACGPKLKVKQLPATGTDVGTLDTSSTSDVLSPCGGGMMSPAVAYVFQLTAPKVIVASTDDSRTNADTVIDIRSADCVNPSSHLACSDDVDANNTASTVTQALPAGTYYLIVSGHDASVTGDFALDVELFNGEGATCAMQTDCGPGLVCRTPLGGAAQVCAKPVCSDGQDDDADGQADYPNDPGCNSPNGDTEDDDCPDGPNCPECANGDDDDGDGSTDYPGDLTCKAAGDASEACATSEGVEVVTQPVTAGDTTGATNDVHPTCGSSSSNAPDRTYRLDLPATTTLTITMGGSTLFDTVTELLDATCGGTPIKCSDPAAMTVTNLAAGTYYFVVDGFLTTSDGPYTINVNGKIANNESCEGPLALSGALTCGPGFACKGAPGARTCKKAQCNDGQDNNGNSKTDFPNDPGCDSASDDTETTVCPGPLCPVCSNGVDDDLDGKIDFPMDPSCVAASGTSETCVAAEGVTPLTTASITGDTSTATDDIKLSCASSTSTGKDLVYELDLPAMRSLQLKLTASFDAATAVLGASCGNPSLACSDPNTLTMTDVAAGTYFYVVDGWSSGSGEFTVEVSGTIENGASCESPLAEAGALTCSPGYTCKGPDGAKTCQPPQCSDGTDNNGDGKADYPADPGCATALDDTETTVCPGPMCPACSNGADDDGDQTTDFPADLGCGGAGSATEAFCSVDPDFAGVIAMPTTTGTLAGAADNYDQTCQTNTGNDAVFALQLPVPVATLRIDTDGSPISDTVLSLHDASCGAELECDDDDSTEGFRSLIEIQDVPAGNYAIQLDGFGLSNNGEFTLNVKGTVAPQTACTSSLFTAGVLVCPQGTSCTGGKCQ